MSILRKHEIYAGNSRRPILEWVKDHTHRNYPQFEDDLKVETLKKIVKTEDKDARDLMMAMYAKMERLQEISDEQHKEMDTLYRGLENCDEQIDKAMGVEEDD